ncbi:MAG: hypothetical protein HY822_14530 [Acidobacteria bacterium]|nr:hypothetical protein [Acidobacteriota bacterium]
MSVFAFVAAAVAIVVTQDQTALRRTGCGADDQVLARLAGGTPVTPRFAFDGACYKVTVSVEGQTVDGYLPASTLEGLEQFESARRAARATAALPAPPRAAAPSAGGSARRLAEAGLAAYRGDDVRGAIDLWRQSLEKEPDSAVDTLLRRAQRELQADVSGSKKAGTRFVLRYDETKLDSESARGLLAVLEQEYSRISYELGCRAEERLTAIVQSLDDFRRSTDAAAWSGGQYDGRIRVAMLEAAPGAATHRAFAHEIVHACLAGLGQYPLWLHEGLAQKLSGDQVSPALAAALKSALRGGAVPRLDRIGQDWSRLSARHSALAYGLALSAVELYYQHYAALGIRNLLRNPQLLDSITADLDRRLRE